MLEKEFVVTPRFTERERYMLSSRLNESHEYATAKSATDAIKEVFGLDDAEKYTIYNINKLQEALVSLIDIYNHTDPADFINFPTLNHMPELAQELAIPDDNYISKILWQIAMHRVDPKTPYITAYAFYMDAAARFDACTNMSIDDKIQIVYMYKKLAKQARLDWSNIKGKECV